MEGMKDSLISVVVPIYNVEKYLTACIESILRQTYKNLEIILVDDGSTDACPQICDEYILKDSRIQVIHKDNGGLSDARNVGMNASIGKYITFVDSDDLLDSKFIEELYNAMIINKADMAFCDYCRIDENCMHKEYKGAGKVSLLSNYICLEMLYNPKKHGMEFVAWGKLYKMELFKNNGVNYPIGKIHEDTYTTYKVCYYACRIAFIDSQRYFYRVRSGSIMSSKFSEKNLDKLDASREACSFFEKKGEKRLLALAFNDCLHSTIRVYCEMHDELNCGEFERLKRKVLLDYRTSLNEYMGKVKIEIKKKLFYYFFGIFPCVKLAKLMLKKSEGGLNAGQD